VLGDGARHLHDGRLLEAVSANQLARHLRAAAAAAAAAEVVPQIVTSTWLHT
jgi:hypothetical protein